MLDRVDNQGKEIPTSESVEDINSKLDDIIKEYATKKYRIIIVATKKYSIEEFSKAFCGDQVLPFAKI